MTDEIEDEHGLGYEQQQFTATTTTSSIQDLPGSSASHSYNVGAMASTSSSAAAPGVAPPGVNLRPSGPVCEFGDRLGYTYFSKPLPTAAQLNTAHRHTETFWLTVDNDLTYLSFFRDTGPVSSERTGQDGMGWDGIPVRAGNVSVPPPVSTTVARVCHGGGQPTNQHSLPVHRSSTSDACTASVSTFTNCWM